MNYTTIYGAAVLMALLFALLPALDKLNIKPFGDRRRGLLFDWRDFLVSELGAVSVTYSARGGNGAIVFQSTTAPTAIQAQQMYKQAALIVFGVTADVQALFTHNMGLDVSAPAFFEPEVLGVCPISTTTYHPLFTFDWTNTNVLKINKVATDAPTTIVVSIRRPHTVGQ
jgi:hypothetical protein